MLFMVSNLLLNAFCVLANYYILIFGRQQNEANDRLSQQFVPQSFRNYPLKNKLTKRESTNRFNSLVTQSLSQTLGFQKFQKESAAFFARFESSRSTERGDDFLEQIFKLKPFESTELLFAEIGSFSQREHPSSERLKNCV